MSNIFAPSPPAAPAVADDVARGEGGQALVDSSLSINHISSNNMSNNNNLQNQAEEMLVDDVGSVPRLQHVLVRALDHSTTFSFVFSCCFFFFCPSLFIEREREREREI